MVERNRSRSLLTAALLSAVGCETPKPKQVSADADNLIVDLQNLIEDTRRLENSKGSRAEEVATALSISVDDLQKEQDALLPLALREYSAQFPALNLIFEQPNPATIVINQASASQAITLVLRSRGHWGLSVSDGLTPPSESLISTNKVVGAVDAIFRPQQRQSFVVNDPWNSANPLSPLNPANPANSSSSFGWFYPLNKTGY